MAWQLALQLALQLAWQLAWLLAWQLHGVADVQPAAGISFSKMAANQASCPSTLQATKKSSSVTVRSVQVEGASLLCEVARDITSPLVPLWVFHTIHSVAHPDIRAAKRMVSARLAWNIVPDP